MSGLVVWWDRSGRPVDRAVLGRMVEAQSHRGPDGVGVHVEGPVAVVHHHFKTTPEEVDESQPVARNRVVVVLDGFLTNRRRLFGALDDVDPGSSDAKLLAAAYNRWGAACVRRLDGAFAFAIWDPHEQRLILGRDALGARRLVLTEAGGVLLAASEERTLLTHPLVRRDRDRSTVTRYFALLPPRAGHTFFTDIAEVEPGTEVLVQLSGRRIERWWQPDPERRLECCDDQEYALVLRNALNEAVGGCARSAQRPSVLMSGGLDSTALAGVAASAGLGPLAITWVFDSLPGADERDEAATMARHNGLEHVLVRSDDCAPGPELIDRAVLPDFPRVNPFRGLLDRAYTEARDRAGRVVLTGWFADAQYLARHHWLAEMIRDRGWGAGALELSRVWRHQPPWTPEGLAPLRHVAVRTLLGRRTGGRGGSVQPPPWLTQEAADLLRDELAVSGAKLSPAEARLEAARSRRLAGVVAAEQPHTHGLGLEVRYPFATRAVFETLLAMPAYLLTRGGFRKFVQGLAVRKELPDPLVQTRRWKHLGSLYQLGMERVGGMLRGGGRLGDDDWERYVDTGWIMARRAGAKHRGSLTGDLIPWEVASWLRWVRVLEDSAWPTLGRAA